MNIIKLLELIIKHVKCNDVLLDYCKIAAPNGYRRV